MTSDAAPLAPDVLARHHFYKGMVGRLRDLIHRRVPSGAIVAVVSKGDPDLVSLVGRQGWHFPQDSNGGYVGYHPRDSESAIEGLEELRSRGADFLVLPATSHWWLEHYADFATHIRRRYDTFADEADTGIIYALGDQSSRNVPDGYEESPDAEREAHHHALLTQQLSDLTAHLLLAEQAVSVVHPEGDAAHQIEGRVCMQLHVKKPSAALQRSGSADHSVADLTSQRRQGAGSLVIPRNAFGWWEFSVEFRLHVQQEYRCITQQHHVCLIYDLNPRES